MTLPLKIKESDLKFAPGVNDRLDWNVGDGGVITLYEVKGRSVNYWVIATLSIGSPGRGRRTFEQRTYGITLAGNVCRVGGGPHVLRTVRVYIKESRKVALKPLIDLYDRGMADAGMIRDRIGSRRAEGQLRRANGEHSWYWNR